MAHTKTPWQVEAGTYLSNDMPTRYWKTWVSSELAGVCSTYGASEEESQANARLIVTAVNAFELMRGALEECRVWIMNHTDAVDSPTFLMDRTEAALRLAKDGDQ